MTKLVFSADMGVDDQAAIDVSDYAKQQNPDVVLLAGDVFYPDGVRTSLNDTVGLHYPGYDVLAVSGSAGNDLNSTEISEADWSTYFGRTSVFSELRGDVRIIGIDSHQLEGLSNEDTLAHADVVFLLNELDASVAAGEPWRIVMWHHQSHVESDSWANLRNIPIRDHGADVIVHGGIHGFCGRVLSGGSEDGLVVACVGNGGRDLNGSFSGLNADDVTDTGSYGFVFCESSASRLTLKYFAQSGPVSWNVVKEQDAPTPCPPCVQDAPDLDQIPDKTYTPTASQQVKTVTYKARNPQDPAQETVKTFDITVEAIPQPWGPEYIDDQDAGFSMSGSGWGTSTSSGNYGQTHRWNAAGSGAAKAEWTATGLPPGTYEVAATWKPGGNRATDAPFTILDDTTERIMVEVNQENAPDADYTDGGMNFQVVGTAQIDSGTIVVRLDDEANEYVIADAVRIVKL